MSEERREAKATFSKPPRAAGPDLSPPPPHPPTPSKPCDHAAKTGRDSEGESMISTLATTRRQFLGQLGVAGAALMSGSALADPTIDLPLPSGPRQRSITTAFPQKRAMILQRTRPPLLETPFEAFDNS